MTPDSSNGKGAGQEGEVGVEVTFVKQSEGIIIIYVLWNILQDLSIFNR